MQYSREPDPNPPALNVLRLTDDELYTLRCVCSYYINNRSVEYGVTHIAKKIYDIRQGVAVIV